MQATGRGLTVTKEIDHSADLGKAGKSYWQSAGNSPLTLTKLTKEATPTSQNAS